MNISSHIPALEHRDIKRYAREIEDIVHRGARVSREVDRRLSFSEVADKIQSESFDPSIVEGKAQPAESETRFMLWEKAAFAFGDVVDVINPLQHIPIVATLYRNMTGDKIGMLPRVLGGALWGRIGGFAAGLANAVVDCFTGKDIGDHVYSALFGGASETEAVTVVARRSAAPARPVEARAEAAGEGHKSSAHGIGNLESSFDDERLARADLHVAPSVPEAASTEESKPLAIVSMLAALNKYWQTQVDEGAEESFSFRYRA